MSIFLRLKEERERLGMTQDAFGTVGGVLKRAVINYEKGERAPDVTFLAGIAKAGADVLYIVTGERSGPAMERLSKQEAELLDSYIHSDFAGRAALQAVAALARRAGSTSTGQGHTVTIGGDVGQSIAGDQSNSGGVSFSVGKRR